MDCAILQHNSDYQVGFLQGSIMASKEKRQKASDSVHQARADHDAGLCVPVANQGGGQ